MNSRKKQRARDSSKGRVRVAPKSPSPSQSTKTSAGYKSVASGHSHRNHQSHHSGAGRRHPLQPQRSNVTAVSDATQAPSSPGSSATSLHKTLAHRHHRAKSHRRGDPSSKREHQRHPSKRPKGKPVTQVIDMHNSKESANGLGGLLKRVTESVAKSVRSVRRKKPDHFRDHIQIASSPSDLSFKSITEHYTLPDGDLKTTDDVFRARGFKKLNKIDEGAFGIVSRAIKIHDRALVAVKEVDLRRKRAKRVEEMKRELFVLQKVDHVNVVRLIEHFTIDQTLVIIMEFCAGGNLTSYLKENAIDEQEASFLFKQMALSLKVLHRKGIAHRDVKLNNFLMDSTRKCIKIADFGLSIVYFRQASGLRLAKTYCGTEPYMAPELIRRNSLGARSYNALYADIWSLGICLFAMVTRTFPFRVNTSQRGLLRAQTARRWRFPRKLRDNLSEEIKDLTSHMLDPEPDRRISINGVLAHPWINHNQLVALSYDEG